MTETKMQLVDWLDDLCVRFIVNLPKEELESVERICFQVEEAQWFYEDFIRPLDPQLPSLNLRQFCLLIFQHCPLLSGFSPIHHSAAFSEFLAYKTRVPVRGAIMLNEAMDQVVLVKGWKKGANWSFPRGKINKDEKDLDCAVREVYEETGFDIQAAGLVAAEDTAKYIEVTMREQHMRLYVFRDVPMDTPFEPRTRKEISKIQWYKLSELPTIKKKQQHQEGRGEDLAKNANKFYMVAPFLVPLKKWIAQQKKQDTLRNTSANSNVTLAVPQTIATAQAFQETDRITEAPPPDNMSRLLANLRNSSQKPTITEFTELSDPTQIAKDASIQLKTLLQVPIKSSGNSNSVASYQSLANRRLDDQGQTDLLNRKNESAKANAMLSSLRAAGTVGQSRPPLYSSLPQTPFEQMLGTPPIPNSPRPRAPKVGHGRVPSPPPQFPYSPDQVGLKNEEQAGVKQKGPTSASGRYSFRPSVQRFSAPQLSRTSLQNSTKAHQLPLAPYQRTGDPYFAQVPKQSADITSSIPPASNLPLPKLTTHSSLLLDIFKSGDFGRATLDQSTTKVNSAAVENNSKLELQKANLYPVNLEATLTNARSPQKEALLNLFRASSSSAPGLGQTTPTTLEPPSAPIELSAYPSPSHSRATSQIDQQTFMALPKATINGSMSIRKKPEPTVGRKSLTKAPVSATVTGPLNVPQFDRIAKKPGSPRLANIPPSRRREENKEQQAPPMTILTRPGSKPQSSSAKIVKPIKENVKLRTHSPTPTSLSKANKQIVETSKPFAPQILRRPPQEQHPKPETHSPLSPLYIVTKDNVIPDGPSTSGDPAPDHRHSLLSLFNKPSPGPSPLTPTYKPFVSPLSEKPVRSESTVPFPLDSPRSRMGSLGDGSVAIKDGKDSGRQTPRTNPADKMVLLNFLDDIIKRG
ncbi:mRNA-decapping enzyme subunit 2 [Varicellaria rhodocarpa]|nr:mRNA-decapping enzyme subunit 2 [Varicellaria rhodocarpa]